MKKKSPAFSVASLLFAFPVAAQVVEIGGAGRARERGGTRVLYVEGGAVATVTDGTGRIVGRIAPEDEDAGYVLLDANGKVIARSGHAPASSADAASLRNAHWVLGPGALDIQGAETPLVLMTPEMNATVLRR